MCGIVGAVAQRDVVDILVEGLRRLEYRGYDSAGVAVINPSGDLQRLRRLGKVKELSDAVIENPTPGGTGIAHTRCMCDACSCLLYTSPSPRDVEESRMPSSA